MQITIIAGGCRGDVQPYVALGRGLKEARHMIHILSSDDFHDLVTDYDLDFFTTGGSSKAVAQRLQALLEQGKMLKVLAQMSLVSQQQATQAAQRGLFACQGSDLILGGFGGLFSGLALSEKLGIPFMPAYLVPFTPTSTFPSALTPLPQTPLTRWVNKPSHRLAQQTMWQSFRSADNKARNQVLQLPPASFWGPFSTLKRPVGFLAMLVMLVGRRAFQALKYMRDARKYLWNSAKVQSRINYTPCTRRILETVERWRIPMIAEYSGELYQTLACSTLGNSMITTRLACQLPSNVSD